jgi:hypothetical protein
VRIKAAAIQREAEGRGLVIALGAEIWRALVSSMSLSDVGRFEARGSPRLLHAGHTARRVARRQRTRAGRHLAQHPGRRDGGPGRRAADLALHALNELAGPE